MKWFHFFSTLSASIFVTLFMSHVPCLTTPAYVPSPIQQVAICGKLVCKALKHTQREGTACVINKTSFPKIKSTTVQSLFTMPALCTLKTPTTPSHQLSYFQDHYIYRVELCLFWLRYEGHLYSPFPFIRHGWAPSVDQT